MVLKLHFKVNKPEQIRVGRSIRLVVEGRWRGEDVENYEHGTTANPGTHLHAQFF